MTHVTSIYDIRKQAGIEPEFFVIGEQDLFRDCAITMQDLTHAKSKHGLSAMEEKILSRLGEGTDQEDAYWICLREGLYLSMFYRLEQGGYILEVYLTNKHRMLSPYGDILLDGVITLLKTIKGTSDIDELLPVRVHGTIRHPWNEIITGSQDKDFDVTLGFAEGWIGVMNHGSREVVLSWAIPFKEAVRQEPIIPKEESMLLHLWPI